MIHLETLGAIDLRRDGTEVRSVLSQPKRLALLVYLATASPRGFQSRDRLLGLFWPESDEERARNALRQSLHYLRRSLGEAAFTSRGDREVGVDPGEVRCDAVAFEEAIAAGRPREALELYRDEFLAGLYVEDAPEVERWIDEQRSRYRRMAVDAAKAAADAEEARGDVRAAAIVARRGLVIEPHDEAGLRRLLDLLDRSGERAQAVQAYEEFARRFDEELGLTVSPETKAAAERLRAAPSSPAAEIAAAPSASPAADRMAPPGAGSVAVPPVARSSPRRLRRLRVGPRVALAIGGVLLVLGMLAGLLIARTRGMVASASAADAGPPAIAVLPFANMSNDPSQDFYSDGMADELMTALARVPGLRVVARSSAFAFKGQAVSVDSIARALRVAHVLEGSVRIDGDRLRITAQLVDAASGYQLWGDAFDGTTSHAFAMQDSIARAIVAALEPSLGLVREPPMPSRETTDPQAHADLLRGLAALRTEAIEDYARADTFFARAVARDSMYARAWAGLSITRMLSAYRRTVPVDEGYAEARAMAQRALALDPTVSDAHAMLGRIAEDHDWDFAAAERHYRRALEVAPGDALPYRQLGRLLAHLGRADEAIVMAERAVELDPMPGATYRRLATVLLLTGRHARALEAFETALALAPGTALTLSNMAFPLSMLGRHDDAVEAAESALARAPVEQLFLATAGWANARAGRHDRARDLLARLETMPRPAAYYRAMVHVGLGQTDRALALLETAANQRESMMPEVGSAPTFEPLHALPRFHAVLGSVGLAR